MHAIAGAVARLWTTGGTTDRSRGTLLFVDESAQRALWRWEVGTFRRREGRRVFDVRVHVGTPGGHRESFVVRAAELTVMDHWTRAEVITRLVAAAGAAARAAWLTRPGLPVLHDTDLEWMAAAREGFAAHAVGLPSFHAITRTGWLDVATGEARTWKRLRL